MAGIDFTQTTPIGNVGGRQIHYARSSLALLPTMAADAARLVGAGGPYRAGDIVLVLATDDARVCEVLSTGALKPQAAYPGAVEPLWDDLRFPVQGINPPGAVSDPSVEVTTGMLLFEPAKTEVIAGVAQMPHAWAEGTVIVPHVHWQKTTSAAGNVLWRFEYDNMVNPGDVSLLTYANVIDASAVVAGTPDDDTAGRNLISSFGEVAMTDQRISTCILWKLSRVGGDALDTYAGDARLLELDFHYQIDQPGSFQQFIKAPA